MVIIILLGIKLSMTNPFTSKQLLTSSALPPSLLPSPPSPPRYATCHWCHVMEGESFESMRIAKLLNDKFVPIKVDREERPDVDSVYMSFIQAATGGGGWPMTVFLTPDRKPFTGGTYFPEPRFAAILEKVHEAWTNQQAEVEAQGERVVDTFKSKLAGAGLGASLQEMSETEAESRIRGLQAEATNIAFQQLNETYDEIRGGFVFAFFFGLFFPSPFSSLGLGADK